MKRLVFASLAVAALASCSQESTMDVSITSTQIPIEFTTYASGADTKGVPIDTNTEFKGSGESVGAFEVSSYFDQTSLNGDPLKYFGFSTVQYDGSSAWENKDVMYWPNASGDLYFGAYYPSGDSNITSSSYSVNSSNAHSLVLAYTANTTVGSQTDLMYALTSAAYTAPAAATYTDAAAVNLHFKHALTQIEFTATKDANIEVSVTGVTICNVMSTATFTATTATTNSATTDTDGTVLTANVTTTSDSWSTATTVKNYLSELSGTGTSISVTSSSTAVRLTDADDALMLIPQELTAWDPTGNTTSDAGSYLAINCTIKHTGDGIGANIVSGLVFIPFDTDDIVYEQSTTASGWKAGYKITYNLHFGGGYYDADITTIPDPGNTPTPADVVPTLRPITYTTTVDAWDTLYDTEAATDPQIDLSLGDSETLDDYDPADD